MPESTAQAETPQAEAKPVIDPTDASGADGANGATDRKPRAGKRARMPKATAEVQAPQVDQPKAITGDQREEMQAALDKADAKAAKPQAPKPQVAAKVDTVETPADLRAALVEARTAGWSRTRLTDELVKIYAAAEGHNVIWKAENGGRDKMGEVVPAYLPALETLLRSIKDGSIKPPERKAVAGAGPGLTLRGRLDEAEDKVAKATAVLAASPEPATKAELRAAVDEALAVLVANPRDGKEVTR